MLAHTVHISGILRRTFPLEHFDILGMGLHITIDCILQMLKTFLIACVVL